MKRIIAGILWVLAEGCISNDVPDPVIYGNVTKIEFNGQQKCAINTKTRTIELTLSDTVDIQRVCLNTLELEATPARKQEVLILPEASIAVDTFLNLSQPCRFTVTTYQEYEWTIKAEQPIERWLKVENQAGDEVINVREKMVSVYLKKGQNLSDVRITDLQLGPSIATYEPTWFNLKDFRRKQTILMNCFGRTERWEIAMFEEREEEEPSGEGLSVTVDAWAHFAYVNAKLSAGSEGIPAFEYKSGGGAWQRVEAEVSGNVFQTKLGGLKANTRYDVRAVVGGQIGTESTFTTERDDQVPYSNFDTWYLDGKAWCTGEDGIVTWDSGNKGSANYGNTNPTTEEKNDVVNGSAARLASCYAVIKFAAGSLYTGKFGGLDGMNAKLDFGIPYTCRPTQLKGYYKYIPGVVNKVGDKYNGKFDFLRGTTDSCHIYIALCDWEEKTFQANSTPPGTFVDYSRNNPSILAYGELKSNRRMTKYEPFTIELEWRNMERKPTCIVIVATSSKYGDYFTGSTESVLLLDEFELVFD